MTVINAEVAAQAINQVRMNYIAEATSLSVIAHGQGATVSRQIDLIDLPAVKTTAFQYGIISTSGVIDDRTAFSALADALEAETLTLSSPAQMLQHSSIADLRSRPLGEVVPLIMSRIDGHPIVWMAVLHDLSGAMPTPRRDWGKVRVMVDHWKRWSRDLGYTV